MGDQNIYQPSQDSEEKKKIVYREEKRPARPLSQFELDQAIRRKQLIYLHFPEMVDEIRLLTELGLIRGWGAVCFVRIHSTGEEV